MKHLLIAAVLSALLFGCKTSDSGRPGEQSYSETGGSKAYYREGENDRHTSKAGHNLHW